MYRRLSFSLFFLLCLTSCSLLLPFYGIKKMQNEDLAKQKIFLLANNIDTTHIFNLSCNYKDSISIDKYALNLYKLAHGTNASPVQFRVYNNTGRLLTGWEQCFGSANKLGYFSHVPMKPFYNHIPINYNLDLANDLYLFDIDSDTRDILIKKSTKYDYIIVLFWAEYAGVFTKRMFSDVYNYINNDTTHAYLVLKLNTAKICK